MTIRLRLFEKFVTFTVSDEKMYIKPEEMRSIIRDQFPELYGKLIAMQAGEIDEILCNLSNEAEHQLDSEQRRIKRNEGNDFEPVFLPPPK